MTNGDLTYEFAPTGGGNEQGFNDGSMDHFLGNPSYYLARESLQNVLDAKIPGPEPARAVFSLSTVNMDQLPDYLKLHEIIKACNRYERESDPDNIKSKKFYEKANEFFVHNPLMHILEIEDFNTTGMYGDDYDKRGNYHKFMKSFGSSGKTTGSGGSFGLGKAAYYAASQLRMIFVSSVYEENKNKKYMFQGKLLLNSFEMNEVTKRGDGSCGLPGQRAVRDPDLIPEMFRRNEIGTTIFVVAFCDYRSWQRNILCSILENFWPAITDGLLEADVGNETIDSGSIERTMRREYSLQTPDKKDKPNPLPYFLAYMNHDPRMIYEKKLNILGNVKIFTYAGKGLPNKTACSRSTGMIVQKQSAYYCTKDHASFFYCDNTDGSEILKRMENPRHDEWRARNGPVVDGEPDETLEKAEKELKEFIREAHARFGSGEKSESVNILNLEQYLFSPADDELGIEGNSDGNGNLTEEISEEETGSETGALENEIKKQETKIKNKRLKPVIIPSEKIKVTEAESGEIKEWGENGGDGGNSPPSLPVSPDENGRQRRVAIPIQFRSFCPSGDEMIHILSLRNFNNTKSKAEIEIYGIADGTLPLSLSRVSDLNENDLKINGNKIFIPDFEKENTLKLRFLEHGKYSLSIKAYEFK